MVKRWNTLGLVFPVSCGIQIDLTATTSGHSLCDHNCTAELGEYTCASAFTLNTGISTQLADVQSTLAWIELGRQGLGMARQRFVSDHFQKYCKQFRISPQASEFLRENILSDQCEVNLFGGNPEIHPGLVELIQRLKAKGFRVTLTTTGKKLLLGRQFADQLALGLPHQLAFSADDMDPGGLEDLLTMPLAQLKALWKQTDPLHGQRQKCLEGIHGARLAVESGWDCTVLLNMALHKGNLGHFNRIERLLTAHLPQAVLNPYPAQDSFAYGPGDLFVGEAIGQFAALVDWCIAETLAGNRHLTKRLHYWLVMRAVLDTFDHQPEIVSRFLAGHDIWQCHRAPGAGLYLQIGKRNRHDRTAVDAACTPGGFPGCYWNNETTTASTPLTDAGQVPYHLLGGGMEETVRAAGRPCPGCCMPRLWFNMVVTELGLHPALTPAYLELRRRHAGV